MQYIAEQLGTGNANSAEQKVLSVTMMAFAQALSQPLA